MEPVVTSLWNALTALGGTLALTLIVAIAVGINALTLLFCGSAVVVLERFARTAKGFATLAGVALVWALGVGAIAQLAGPDLQLVLGAADGGPLQVVDASDSLAATAGLSLPLWLAVAMLSAALTGVLALVLPLLPSRPLALGTLALLGLGYALVVGGSANVVYAVAPAIFTAVALVLLRWRRARREARAPETAPLPVGEAERLLRVLLVPLALGVVLALVLPGPAPLVAAPGALLIMLFFGLVLLGLAPLAAAGFLATRQRVEWFIAVRYLLAKRRQTFISIITGICVVGIAAGVWLIIVVLSVMNGFERTWREEIIGNRAHFTVQSGLGPFEDYDAVLEEVRRSPQVVGASPFVDAEGIVRSSSGIVGVRVRGVDPASVGDVTDLREDLIAGSLDALGEEPPPAEDGSPGDPAIVVGSQLAVHLGLSVDDPIIVISPFGGAQTPLGPAPRLTRFRVVGIFESSFFQYDEMFTYVSLASAQDFRRTGDVVDGIEVRTTDPYRSQQIATAVARAVKAEFGPFFYTRDWKEFFPAFFQALKTERVMMFVLLAMIMVVAAFAIVSTLVMMIMEKSSDIAILKAMGASDGAIERIFAIEGTLIGLVGTAIGVVAAISVTARIDWIQRQIEAVTGIDTLPASIYQIRTLPAELDVGQIVVSVVLAMVLALGATLLPSRQGARLDPVEALRYE